MDQRIFVEPFGVNAMGSLGINILDESRGDFRSFMHPQQREKHSFLTLGL